MNSLLIRNGALVTATDILYCDLLVHGERIEAIGHHLSAQDAKVIDASGCYVLPGVIDPHVHIQLDTGVFRTADDWQTATASAALGGITTVIDFATQFPEQDTRTAIAQRHREITGINSAKVELVNERPLSAPLQPYIDYALHCMLTRLPDEDTELERWMTDLRDAGISAIKIYTTYRPNYFQDDASLLHSMRAAAKANLVVMVHAENDALVTAATTAHVAAGETGLSYHGSARPGLAEVEAVHRLLFLAAEARCELYIVHCSMGRSVELIAEARKGGQRVYAETCPQYLLLDDRKYRGADAWRYIMQPPLRDPYQPAFLWQLLGSGAVHSLGTDHCDYTIAQKLGLRPARLGNVQALIDALLPEQRAVLTARLGLFDGRQRTLDETAHYLGLDRDSVRMRELEALRKLRDHHETLENAAAEINDIDWVRVKEHPDKILGPRLPFTQTPGGLPGLQTSLPLMVTDGVLSGHLSWPDLVRLMCTNPARIFRLYPRKGNLAPGADADLVIYDPSIEQEIGDDDQATIGGYTPYAGKQVKGRVRDTILRGQIVVRNGELIGTAGWGKYVPALTTT